MSLKLLGTAYSHHGAVREKNEDNFNLFGETRSGTDIIRCHGEMNESITLAAVCDGIGGEDAGEVASEIAVNGLCTLPGKLDRGVINKLLLEINKTIASKAKELGNRMGCTFAGVYFENGRALCCNVGDSKVYLLRDKKIRQLSVDHTVVSQQIRLGLISSEDEAPDNIKHTLTQNLGIDPEEFGIEPFFSQEIELRKKDTFLICSDGLTDVVDNDEKEKILTKWRGFCFNKQDAVAALEKTAEDLVDTALKSGSRDNITVVIVKVL